MSTLQPSFQMKGVFQCRCSKQWSSHCDIARVFLALSLQRRIRETFYGDGTSNATSTFFDRLTAPDVGIMRPETEDLRSEDFTGAFINDEQLAVMHIVVPDEAADKSFKDRPFYVNHHNRKRFQHLLGEALSDVRTALDDLVATTTNFSAQDVGSEDANLSYRDIARKASMLWSCLTTLRKFIHAFNNILDKHLRWLEEAFLANCAPDFRKGWHIEAQAYLSNLGSRPGEARPL